MTNFATLAKRTKVADGCRESSTMKRTKIQMKILTNLEKLKNGHFAFVFLRISRLMVLRVEGNKRCNTNRIPTSNTLLNTEESQFSGRELESRYLITTKTHWQNYFRMMASDSTYCNVLLQRTLMSQTLKCIKLAVTLLFYAAFKIEVTHFIFC